MEVTQVRCFEVSGPATIEASEERQLQMLDIYPELAELGDLVDQPVVLDGEVVALDQSGKPSFNTLQNHAAGAQLGTRFVELGSREALLAARPNGLSMAALAGTVTGSWRARDVEDAVRRLWEVNELARRGDGTFVLTTTPAKEARPSDPQLDAAVRERAEAPVARARAPGATVPPPSRATCRWRRAPGPGACRRSRRCRRAAPL